MGRDIVPGRVRGDEERFGSIWSREGMKEMPEGNDNDSDYSFDLSVEDSGFGMGGMGTTMGRGNFERTVIEGAANADQERDRAC